MVKNSVKIVLCIFLLMMVCIAVVSASPSATSISPTSASDISSSEAPPIAYYPFNGNADDQSGRGHNGIVVNAVLTTDRFGNPDSAYAFNGQNSSIEIPDNVDLNPATVTICTWIKVNNFLPTRSGTSGDSSVQWIIFKKNSRTSNFEGYDLKVLNTDHAGSTMVTSHGGRQVSANSEVHSMNISEWYFMTMTAGPESIRLYINGALKDEQSTGFPLDYGNRPLFIGRTGEDYWDGYFKGTIDDVRIYNRILTSEEIAALYSLPPNLLPAAQFTATPTSGTAPLTVAFTDSSTNTPTSWSWSFGDRSSSTEKNPSHTYTSAGTYTVTLTATNSAGSNTLTRTNYITVTSDVTPPTITITSPKNFQRFTTATVTVKGTAADNVGLSKVEVKVGSGAWQTATGTTSWSKPVTMSRGLNRITARATDTSGNYKDASVIEVYIT
jgi:hypothetical protein